MALGGFSGRATRLLAKFLATRAEELWPPVYNDHGIRDRGYIVQFTFSQQDQKSRDGFAPNSSATSKVIPLAASVIQRHIDLSAVVPRQFVPPFKRTRLETTSACCFVDFSAQVQDMFLWLVVGALGGRAICVFRDQTIFAFAECDA